MYCNNVMNAAVPCTCELIRGVDVLPHHTPQHLFIWIVSLMDWL